jgi:hypothetical protein
MNEFVITNDKERKRAVFRLMVEKRQTIRQFMTQWGGVMYRDLIKWTPPRSKETGEENWGAQKKRGEAAVNRDIRKVFKSGQQLENLLENHPLCKKRPRLAEQLKGYVRAGNYQALNRVLSRISPGVQVVLEPSRALHFPQRNSRGVVARARQQYIIPRDSAVNGYVREIQKDVGKAKAGWVTYRLSAKGVPKWVLRHQGSDGGKVDLTGPVYRVSLKNTSQHTVGMRANEIVTPALRILDKKMHKSLQAIAAWKKR